MKNSFGKYWCVSVLSAICLLSPFASAVSNAQTAENVSLADPNVALQPEQQEPKELSQEEIQTFAKDWTEYAQWLKSSGNEKNATAYLGISSSAEYPAEVVKWLEKRNWTTDRFFSLEQKFRETLSAQAREARTLPQIDALEKRIRAISANTSFSQDQKDIMLEKYKGQIKILKKGLESKPDISQKEYDLIKQNYGLLARALSN